MTENLVQQLEEKLRLLVTELQNTRQELNRVQQENSAFLADKNHHAKKIEGLISLLDTLNLTHSHAGQELPA